MATIRELRAKFTAQAKGMQSTIEGIKKDTESLAKKSKDVSKKMSDNFKKTANKMKSSGKKMTKVISVPLAAVGGIAFAAADDIDKAYRDIRVGTGAVGDDLEKLKEQFDIAFKDVPDSADVVSNSLATLNTLTGATGDSLGKLTVSVLDASRTLKEDGVANSEAFGKALAQWQIPAEEGPGKLDKLYKATQDYGIGLGEISKHLTEYGSVLNNAGFSMDESADLFGKLNASGLSVSRIMPGLNMAFRNWADEGKNVQDELSKTITKIQDAEDGGKALSIATEQFGAEGAQRLVTAIRNGAMPALDDLGGALEGSEGLVDDTTKATETFGEKMSTLKNVASTKLAPVGDVLLNLAENAIPPLVAAVEKVSGWFSNLSPTMQKVVPIIGLIVMAIPPLIILISSIISGISTMIPLFAAVGLVISAISAPVWIAIGAITALIAIGVAVWKNWDTVKAKAIEIWGAVSEFLSNTLQGIKDSFNNALNWIDKKTGGKFKFITDTIRRYMDMVWDNIDVVLNFIKNTFKNATDFIKALVTGDFQGMKDAISNQMDNIWNIITGIWDNVMNFFKDINLFSAGKSIIQGLVDGIKNMSGSVQDGITSVVNSMAGKLGKGVNGVIGGVNWVLGKVGVGGISKWDVPQYAKGTDDHPGGPAVVGEKGRELAYVPGVGYTMLGEDGAELTNLPKGASVLPNKETEGLLSSLYPAYANGVGFLSKTWQGAKSVAGKVKDKVSETVSKAIKFMANPTKFFNDALARFGAVVPSFPGELQGFGTGLFSKVKDGFFDFMKDKLSSLIGFADGGIVDEKQLAWIAEGGWAESVISHDPAKRARSQNIWEQTGDELGFASGDSEQSNKIINKLEEIIEAIYAGKDISLVMQDRIVGKILEPIITEMQNRNKKTREEFQN